MGRLALLICVVLLSAAMANGTRPAPGTVAAAAAAAPPASPVVATTTKPTTPVVIRPPPSAAAADSKRKVPNGPDPIHNRGASWAEAPSKRA